ncbi:MAG: hypothetical protein FJ150_02460 [Euryarchaeota archaeon]|nr:hypothetical protein [Euryarchaeota archaeon]
MDKKVLALIILAVVIVGGYTSYYAYASIYLIPEDLKVFKDDLKSLENSTFPAENITEMEQAASVIGNGSSLQLIPAAERKKMADDLRNQLKPMQSQFEEFKQNFTNNREIASRYELIFKGNVANEIRAAYSDEIINLTDRVIKNLQKMAIDLENGDNVAYANDIREFANLMREYNKLAADAEARLQNVVNSLGG